MKKSIRKMQPLFVNTPCSTKIWLQDLKPSTVLSKYNDNHYFKLFMCTIKWGNFGHFLTCLFIFQRRYSCYWNYLEPYMGAGLICNHMLKIIYVSTSCQCLFSKNKGVAKVTPGWGYFGRRWLFSILTNASTPIMQLWPLKQFFLNHQFIISSKQYPAAIW